MNQFNRHVIGRGVVTGEEGGREIRRRSDAPDEADGRVGPVRDPGGQGAARHALIRPLEGHKIAARASDVAQAEGREMKRNDLEDVREKRVHGPMLWAGRWVRAQAAQRSPPHLSSASILLQ